jgi:hypothetical protein
MRVYRINALGDEGKPIVLGTADTAMQALSHLRAAWADHPRAWVTDEYDLEVVLSELVRRADEEQRVQDS